MCALPGPRATSTAREKSRSAKSVTGWTLSSTSRSRARLVNRLISPGAACSANRPDDASRSIRRPAPASLTSSTVRLCRSRISIARLASRSPPGVNARPDGVRVNNGSSSSVRSCLRFIETADSVVPSSSAAAFTDPRRTTHANARSWVGVNGGPRGRGRPRRCRRRPARHPLGAHHLEVGVGEVVEDVGGGVEHGRVLRAAGALGQVGRVVGDHEQGAARREGVERPAHGRTTGIGGDLEVGEHHQVEVGRQGSGQRVTDLPVDGVVDLPALVDGDGRPVDRGDLPAPLGQPAGVASLPAGEVERAARRQRGELGLDELVGAGRPHECRGGVPLVPGGGVHVLSLRSAARSSAGRPGGVRRPCRGRGPP